jgi:hypothetical protein
MNTKIFLDLELTIVESWTDPTLVNVDKIRATLEKFGVTEVGIFSFAIWDDGDVSDFYKRKLNTLIETALGVKISQILTIPEIAKVVFWKTGLMMDVPEFISTWGKPRAFIDWVLMGHGKECAHTNFILIDDVVQNITTHDRDRDITVTLINVNSIDGGP